MTGSSSGSTALQDTPGDTFLSMSHHVWTQPTNGLYDLIIAKKCLALQSNSVCVDGHQLVAHSR